MSSNEQTSEPNALDLAQTTVSAGQTRAGENAPTEETGDAASAIAAEIAKAAQ